MQVAISIRGALLPLIALAAAAQQTQPPAPSDTGAVFKSETNSRRASENSAWTRLLD